MSKPVRTTPRGTFETPKSILKSETKTSTPRSSRTLSIDTSSPSSVKSVDAAAPESYKDQIMKILTGPTTTEGLPSRENVVLFIMYFISMIYVFEKKTIPIGYIILTVTYILTIFYGIKYAYTVKDYFANLTSNSTLICAIILVILFPIFYGIFEGFFSDLKGFNNNKSAIIAFSIIFTLIFEYGSYIFSSYYVESYANYFKYFIILTGCLGIIYNLYSIIMVTSSIFMRTRQVKSYDINVSDSRWSDLVSYNILFYLTAIAIIYIIYKIPSIEETTTIFTYTAQMDLKILFVFLFVSVTSIINYYLQTKITKELPNDSVSVSKKAEDVPDEGTSNQNVFTDMYYWLKGNQGSP